MKNYTFATSGNSFFTYFCKGDCRYFILNKSNIKEIVEKAYEFANPQKRSINSEIEKTLKLLFFGIIKQGKDINLSKFFIDTYLSSNTYKDNAFIAVQNFGKTHLLYECELLIDLLFCISQNVKNIDATINFNEDSNSASLQMMRKNPNSYGMLFDLRLPLEELESYVANHLGIALKLKSGKLVNYGNCVHDDSFNVHLEKYSINVNKLLFNA
jgi:hypothetical protein